MRGFDKFDSNLIDYLKEINLQRLQNYSMQLPSFMVSPLSLKAALVLAMAGAKGDTKSQLIKALDFKSEQGVQDWYLCFMNSLNVINRDALCELAIANGVWSNLSFGRREFRPEYITKVSSIYHAMVKESWSGTMASDINTWVWNQTHGNIRGLVCDNLSLRSLFLINVLYLKSAWYKPFDMAKTHRGRFITSSGNCIEKEFMSKTDSVAKYYQDKTDGSKLVILPLHGGLFIAFILGDNSNILGKIAKAEQEEVHVELPKFCIDSLFDAKLLVNFLCKTNMGAGNAFSTRADFSDMCNNPYYIEDIVQKTRITVEEAGLEASAATYAELRSYGMSFRQAKEFIADRPFSFYIYSADASPNHKDYELLFYGEVNN